MRSAARPLWDRQWERAALSQLLLDVRSGRSRALVHEAFCADLPDAEAAFMAISQRPLAGVAFSDKAPTPTWRTRPSWAVLPAADRAIHPDVHRFSYDRMLATVRVVEGASNAAPLSRPAAVADVVREAVRSCASGG